MLQFLNEDVVVQLAVGRFPGNAALPQEPATGAVDELTLVTQRQAPDEPREQNRVRPGHTGRQSGLADHDSGGQQAGSHFQHHGGDFGVGDLVCGVPRLDGGGFARLCPRGTFDDFAAAHHFLGRGLRDALQFREVALDRALNAVSRRDDRLVTPDGWSRCRFGLGSQGFPRGGPFARGRCARRFLGRGRGWGQLRLRGAALGAGRRRCLFGRRRGGTRLAASAFASGRSRGHRRYIGLGGRRSWSGRWLILGGRDAPRARGFLGRWSRRPGRVHICLTGARSGSILARGTSGRIVRVVGRTWHRGRVVIEPRPTTRGATRQLPGQLVRQRLAADGDLLPPSLGDQSGGANSTEIPPDRMGMRQPGMFQERLEGLTTMLNAATGAHDVVPGRAPGQFHTGRQRRHTREHGRHTIEERLPLRPMRAAGSDIDHLPLRVWRIAWPHRSSQDQVRQAQAEIDDRWGNVALGPAFPLGGLCFRHPPVMRGPVCVMGGVGIVQGQIQRPPEILMVVPDPPELDPLGLHRRQGGTAGAVHHVDFVRWRRRSPGCRTARTVWLVCGPAVRDRPLAGRTGRGYVGAGGMGRHSASVARRAGELPSGDAGGEFGPFAIGLHCSELMPFAPSGHRIVYVDPVTALGGVRIVAEIGVAHLPVVQEVYARFVRHIPLDARFMAHDGEIPGLAAGNARGQAGPPRNRIARMEMRDELPATRIAVEHRLPFLRDTGAPRRFRIAGRVVPDIDGRFGALHDDMHAGFGIVIMRDLSRRVVVDQRVVVVVRRLPADRVRIQHHRHFGEVIELHDLMRQRRRAAATGLALVGGGRRGFG